MILSRQNLPTIDREKFAPASNAARGGYIVADADTAPEIILLASGSEVSLVLRAWEELTRQGKKVRVVSLPCWELFDQQAKEYRDQVLPPSVTKRIGVELASDFGWWKYLGSDGKFIGMEGFGASAPAAVLLDHFGITVDRVVQTALNF